MKNILILPEYWDRHFIGACGWIRLLEPLMRPEITEEYHVEYGYSPEDAVEKPDILIFERLWHPKAADLLNWIPMLNSLKTKGVKIIYSIDDNLPDYPLYQRSDWFSSVHLSVIYMFLSFADKVIVSTPALKERLLPFHQDITVIPNAIDCKSEKSLKKRKEKKVRFGYLASPDNTEYLYTILEPLKKVLSGYKDEVIFEIAGHHNSFFSQGLFNNLPVEFSTPPDSGYKQYSYWILEHCDWDFGLAPITKNDFTRCKSDMKFLDFTRMGIPGVFSDFTPYDTVKQQQAGLIVEDAWENAISDLIENQCKRTELFESALKYVMQERSLQVQAIQWKSLLINL